MVFVLKVDTFKVIQYIKVWHVYNSMTKNEKKNEKNWKKETDNK